MKENFGDFKEKWKETPISIRGRMPTDKMLWMAYSVLKLKRAVHYEYLRTLISEMQDTEAKKKINARKELEGLRSEIEAFPIKVCPPQRYKAEQQRRDIYRNGRR